MLRQTAASTTTVGGDEKHAVCSQPSADISLVIHSFIFIPFLFAPRKSQVTLRVVIWKLILDKRAKGKGERGRFQSCWSNSGDFCFFFFLFQSIDDHLTMTHEPWPLMLFGGNKFNARGYHLLYVQNVHDLNYPIKLLPPTPWTWTK